MTETTPETGIGIIADRTLVRQRLRQSLEENGFTVSANIPPEACNSGMMESPLVQVWIVDIEDEMPHQELLTDLAGLESKPVFYGVDLPDHRMSDDFQRWEKRLVKKLRYHLQMSRSSKETGSKQDVISWPLKSVNRQPDKNGSNIPAEHVWVLGASLGGPNAVKAFIDELPNDLPVAFVYAQHIDQEFAQTLANTIARHSSFQVVLPEPGIILKQGDLLLAPIDNRIKFGKNRRLNILDQGWSGSYSPNIDEVMEAVRHSWPDTCGTIIFSGMGEDGSREARLYNCHQRPVWVQAPETCASSVMPEAIIKTGWHSAQGAPEQLAHKLTQYIEDLVKNKPQLAQENI